MVGPPVLICALGACSGSSGSCAAGKQATVGDEERGSAGIEGNGKGSEGRWGGCASGCWQCGVRWGTGLGAVMLDSTGKKGEGGGRTRGSAGGQTHGPRAAAAPHAAVIPPVLHAVHVQTAAAVLAASRCHFACRCAVYRQLQLSIWPSSCHGVCRYHARPSWHGPSIAIPARWACSVSLLCAYSEAAAPRACSWVLLSRPALRRRRRLLGGRQLLRFKGS